MKCCLLLLLALCGCASPYAENPRVTHENCQKKVEEGKTTTDELRAMFGPPDSITSDVQVDRYGDRPPQQLERWVFGSILGSHLAVTITNNVVQWRKYELGARVQRYYPSTP